jgi:hypothetical protein
MEIGAVLLIVLHALIVFVSAVYISANRRPSAAIAWVLAIIFIPYLGALTFLIVGFGRLPRRRREKQREVNELMLSRTEGFDQLSHRDEWPDWLVSSVRLNRNLGALPVVGGNRAELLPDYLGSIASMVEAVDSATAYVHVEFYILVRDTAPNRFSMRSNARRPAGCGCVCSPTISPGCVCRTGRRLWQPSTRWVPCGTQCCRFDRFAASGADRICATIANSSWLTGRLASPARRT